MQSKIQSLAGEYYDILESLSPIVRKLLNLLERFRYILFLLVLQY